MLTVSVLNNWNYAAEQCEKGINIFAKDMLDEKCIQNLKAIVEITDAKIVLISSWQLSKTAYDALSAQLALFNLKIFDSMEAHDFIEEDIKVSFGDSNKIDCWIEQNKYDNFIVISSQQNLNVSKEHYLVTDPAIGLTKELADQAITILIGE